MLPLLWYKTSPESEPSSLRRSFRGSTAPAVGLYHSKTTENIFQIWSFPFEEALPLGIWNGAGYFCLWNRRQCFCSRHDSDHTKFWRSFKFSLPYPWNRHWRSFYKGWSFRADNRFWFESCDSVLPGKNVQHATYREKNYSRNYTEYADLGT